MYTELIIDQGQPKVDGKVYCSVAELQSKVPGARTVPQIFEGDAHIGGFEALKKKLEAVYA
jgi:glutaredoxin